MKFTSLAVAAASGAILLSHGASAIDCPAAGSSSIIPQSGDVSLGIVTESTKVCTLVAVTTDEAGDKSFTPYGRSYSGFEWEGVNPTNKDFTCTETTCSTTLETAPNGTQYKLFSYQHLATAEEQASRLLIQSTFGPTKADIENYINKTYTPAKFVQDQMALPATLHRSFFRENNQARTHAAYHTGRPRLPCEAGSRWRNFALTWEDKDLPISVDNTTAPYTLRVQGQPRTQMNTLPYPFFPGYSGKLCARPGESLGGRVQVALPGQSCKTFYNPTVEILSTEVFANVTDGTSVPIFLYLPGPTEMRGSEKIVHPESITNTSCATAPITGGKTDIFAKDASGNWWLHDPILVLRDNTPLSPLTDGGASSAPAPSLCASAPMTYQNEKYCKFSANSCASRGIVCPGDVTEVANNPLSTKAFDFIRDDPTDTNNNAHIDFEYQKINSWMNIVLHSDDQLRQRVAWAFANIIAQVRDGQYLDGRTERYLNFYDIFVKHAFGNFRDILKDVAFNPIMGSSLTFLGSKSADKVRIDSGGQKHALADENFAREIMELFTIGLWKLNADGTYQLDSQNQTIPTYDADDILDMARVWTGFFRQSPRGNIEGDFRNNAMSNNWQDPMKVIGSNHDSFPKMKLDGGYIGDGFPLCNDLPDKPWLRKGAHWRLLGTSYTPIMFDQDRDWKGSDNLYVELSTAEPLFSILCGESGRLRGRRTSMCTYPVTVSLDSSLPLNSSSTSPMDSIRVVKVNDIYYEYVQTPCVDLPFYNDGKTIKDDLGKIMCAPPDSMHGSACCPQGNRARPQCLYPGERVKYSTHESRCLAGDTDTVCADFADINGNYAGPNQCCEVFFKHWTSSSCDVKVKVRDDGRVGILHVPQSGMTGNLELTYDANARNYFRVDSWAEDNYPRPLNSCGNGTCSLSNDDACICQTSTVNEPVFSSEYFSSTQPTDLSAIPQSLKIGSIDPTFYDAGAYILLTTWSDSKVTVKAWKHSLGKPEDIVVGVTENNTTRFFKNLNSTVKIVHASDGTEPYAFRNAPKFRLDLSSALVETDLVLDLLFRHQNTAPFISSRLIQRLGSSNPSPGYVGRVANAFTTGRYTNGGIDFGTGEYGDMASTVAAILLDQEARTAAVEADPTSGSLREPLLRVLHLFRSLQYSGGEEFRKMDSQIGQMPYGFPSVFSFFLPHYAPSGPVLSAGLVAPEAFQYDTPQIVGLMKGLFSLAKYGMTSCYGGFYHYGGDCPKIPEGAYTSVAGQLTYVPTSTTDQQMIEEVDLLLTGGRLSNAATTIIMEALGQVSTTEQKLRLTEQLILASPEYHAGGQVQLNEDKTRFEPSANEKEPTSYKAIVYVFMEGGADTYNLLVPHSNCATKDLYAEYANVRGDVAIPKTSLLQINTTSSQQPCTTFGVHPKFAHLRQLYQDGDATFFANTGFLKMPSDRSNYRKNHGGFPIFSHTLQATAMKVNPAGDAYSTGVIGRMMDVLYPNGYLTSSTSTGRGGASSTGLATSNDPYKSPRVSQLSGSFTATPFDPVPSISDLPSRIKKLNNATTLSSSIYGETWSSAFMDSLESNQRLYEMIHTISADTSFPSSSIGSNLKFVARMIKARNIRKVERDAFAVVFGSFDSHSSTTTSHDNLYGTFNSALASFTAEMKKQEVWEKVVLVAVSEFGRSLSSNSGLGTDHGWGGNYFAVGGAIRGKKIHGNYPDDFSVNNTQIIGRGIVPTMPFEAIFNGIASWFGVEESDLDLVLPNRNKFTSSLLSEDDMFHPVTNSPTTSPTEAPSSAPSTAATLDPNRFQAFSTSFNFYNIRTDNTGVIAGRSQQDSRVTISGAYDGNDHVMSFSLSGMDFDGGGKSDDSISWKIRAQGMTGLSTQCLCTGPNCGAASSGTPGGKIHVNGYGWGICDGANNYCGTVDARQSIIFTVEDIELNTNERGEFSASFHGFHSLWMTGGRYIFGYGFGLEARITGSHTIQKFDPPMKTLQYTVHTSRERNRQIGGWFNVTGLRDMCKEDGMQCTAGTDCCNGVCHVSGYCGTEAFMSQLQWSEEINLALSQPATQSSMSNSGVAGRAVDGNTSGRWADKTTTHTNVKNALPSWWKVDLTRDGMVGMAEIKSITLWNRNDCCSFRMDKLKIVILDSNGEEVKMVQIETASPTFNTFVFDEPLPQGVTVEVRKDEGSDSVISIAEAVVMGRYRSSVEQGE